MNNLSKVGPKNDVFDEGAGTVQLRVARAEALELREVHAAPGLEDHAADVLPEQQRQPVPLRLASKTESEG